MYEFFKTTIQSLFNSTYFFNKVLFE